jgi:ParB family chromosome partitioning protein
LIPRTAAGGGGIDTVDIDLITPNPEQPRATFNQEALEQLAASIREHGVLQPVVVTEVPSELVRPGGSSRPMTYQLIAGERRLQAARMAGMTRMPVVIREATGAALLEIALVENLLREDLNPLEEAAAFHRLTDEFRLTQEDIGGRIGRSRTSVANTLRLLGLAKEIQDSLRSGQITEGHARALLSIETLHLRLDVWRKIVSDELTVRQAEEFAKAVRAGAETGAHPAVRELRLRLRDPDVQALEDDLRHALGTAVTLRRRGHAGSILIRFHSDEELEGIIEKLSRGL